jgi:hypothetical protein
MGSAVSRGAVVAACTACLLAFAAGAASHTGRSADLVNWQSTGATLGISFQRDGMNGPTTSVQAQMPNQPCDGGGSPPTTSGSIFPFVASIPVAGDGTFSYDGRDEGGPDPSRFQISGRFNGRTVSGSFTYVGTFANGATCHTAAPVSFTATCDECPKPGGGGSGGGSGSGSALGAADRFVPFKQVGRAPLGSTIAAFRARYPRDLWQGGHRDKRTGGQVSFFRLDRRSEPGDPHGLALMVLSDRSGRIWSVSAHTYDINDRSSWLQGANHTGIGSTFTEIRKAFPGIKCGELSEFACSIARDTAAGARFMFFTFERSVQRPSSPTAPGRVTALGIQCAFLNCHAHLKQQPKPKGR